MCVLYLCIMTLTAGCVDEPWVKEYVKQESGPIKTEQYKALEDNLREAEVELGSLHKETEENTEQLKRQQEAVDTMEAKLSALEHTLEILGTQRATTATEPEVAGEPTAEVAQQEVRSPGLEVQESKLPEESPITLAEQLVKLQAKTDTVSRRIEHVDNQYQQYNKELGGLKIDMMNEMDTLNEKMTAQENKITALKDTQKAIFAQIAEQSQWDVEALEQKLQELIEGLPEK